MTAASAQKAAVDEDRKIEPLRPSNLQTRAAAVLDFSAVVPAETPREDILEGEFWVHVIGKILLFSEIRVLWEDGSKYARVLAIHVNGRFSRFKCLEWHDLEKLVTLPAAENETVSVKHNGIKKWALVDTATGAIIKDMIATQVEALKEREDLLRARAR